MKRSLTLGQQNALDLIPVDVKVVGWLAGGPVLRTKHGRHFFLNPLGQATTIESIDIDERFTSAG